MRHLTSEEAVARWPRLTRHMQRVAILSPGEAGCALRDYLDAREGRVRRWMMWSGGGEAVAEYGGPRLVIECAVAFRHIGRHKPPNRAADTT